MYLTPACEWLVLSWPGKWPGTVIRKLRSGYSVEFPHPEGGSDAIPMTRDQILASLPSAEPPAKQLASPLNTGAVSEVNSSRAVAGGCGSGIARCADDTLDGLMLRGAPAVQREPMPLDVDAPKQIADFFSGI